MHVSNSTARSRVQEISRGKDKARGFDPTIPARTADDRKRRHRAIARYYAGGAPWSLAVQRVAEIDRFFADKYGTGGDPLYILPDDDAGRDDALIMCRSYAGCPVSAVGIRHAWLSLHAPWMDAGERTLSCGQKAHRWRADTLARKLGLCQAVRQRLSIKTIGAIDLPKAARDRLAKERRRERKESARRAAGKLTRTQYLERNASNRTKPWLALGISKATYYRRMRQVRPLYSRTPYRSPTCLIATTGPIYAAGNSTGVATCKGVGGRAPSAQSARCARAA
jgi:hypothetical protein